MVRLRRFLSFHDFRQILRLSDLSCPINERERCRSLCTKELTCQVSVVVLLIEDIF